MKLATGTLDFHKHIEVRTFQDLDCLSCTYWNVRIFSHSTELLIPQYTESTALPNCGLAMFGSSNSTDAMRCRTVTERPPWNRNWSWSLPRCLVDLKVNVKLRKSRLRRRYFIPESSCERFFPKTCCQTKFNFSLHLHNLAVQDLTFKVYTFS